MMPEAFLSVSCEILPAIRFYDRVSTTSLNAYIGPVLDLYLGPKLGLLNKLAKYDFQGILLIMASNGGVISPEVSMRIPGLTLLSGPAGGPVAGLAYAEGQGFADTITCDMGGTSFDVALIKDGKPLTTTEGEINRLRISWPMLDVVTIGAGGGSIGWIDEVGLLRMGPQSAGADPGPACYDIGGTEPTCSDADLVLGYLDPDFFAGGRMKLSLEKATKAVEEKIAKPLGFGVMEAAAGMYEVINVGMAAAVREIAVKAGYDPRDFPLVTAGGAGPNHACMIALALSIPEILVPRESSIFCAAGMLRSDLKHDFVRTYPTTLDKLDVSKFQGLFDEMKAGGDALLAEEGIPTEPHLLPAATGPALHPPVPRGIGGALLGRDQSRQHGSRGQALPPGARRPLRLLAGGPRHPGGAHEHAPHRHRHHGETQPALAGLRRFRSLKRLQGQSLGLPAQREDVRRGARV